MSLLSLALLFPLPPGVSQKPIRSSQHSKTSPLSVFTTDACLKHSEVVKLGMFWSAGTSSIMVRRHVGQSIPPLNLACSNTSLNTRSNGSVCVRCVHCVMHSECVSMSVVSKYPTHLRTVPEQSTNWRSCTHPHACAHTRMAQVSVKVVCNWHVAHLHLAFSVSCLTHLCCLRTTNLLRLSRPHVLPVLTFPPAPSLPSYA